MNDIVMNDILNVKMQENDADAETIRDYLKALLKELWREGEDFGGKKPFGNSGWEYELYDALAVAGLIGRVVDNCEIRKANKLIFVAIQAL